MTDLLQAIYPKSLPLHFSEADYIGKSYCEITLMHQSYNKMPYCDKENAFVLEIRLEDATLSCVIENHTCTEAYRFPD